MKYKTIPELRLALWKKMGWTDEEIEKELVWRALEQQTSTARTLPEIMKERKELADRLANEGNRNEE